MPYGYGYGRGFGFRGGSPPWPYVGRGRGGLPRCWYFGAPATPPYAPSWGSYPSYGGVWEAPNYDWPGPYGATPYTSKMSQHEELEFLKGEANAVKAQLDEIEARIKSLESN